MDFRSAEKNLYLINANLFYKVWSVAPIMLSQ